MRRSFFRRITSGQTVGPCFVEPVGSVEYRDRSAIWTHFQREPLYTFRKNVRVSEIAVVLCGLQILIPNVLTVYETL